MDLITWTILVYGALAIFVGAIVQGTTGLGFGMIAAPILLFINPIFVPGPLLLLALLLSSMVAIREWQAVDWRGLSFALAGRIAGSVLAGFTIAVIPLLVYELIFGLMVLAAVMLSAAGWSVQPSNGNLVTAGFASGYMGTLTSIGAPPIALAYQRGKGPVVRATLSVFLVIGAAVSITVLIAVDKFPANQMLLTLAFLPALLAGFWVSNWVVPRLHGRLVRYSVLALSAVSAFILISKSLSTMI